MRIAFMGPQVITSPRRPCRLVDIGAAGRIMAPLPRLSIASSRLRRIRVWLFLLAGTILIAAADRLLVAHGLRAVYFDGPDWRDAPSAITSTDALPSSAVLHQRRPDFFSRPFSVEWRGYVVVL